MSKCRGWCFTLNNWTADQEAALRELPQKCTLKYLVFAKEVGEQGTPHLQGFLYLQSPRAFNGVKKLLPDGCHIESMRGTPQQASAYCKKPETVKDDIFEHGELPQQGKRNDLHVVCDAIREGQRSLKSLRREFPMQMAKYGEFVRQVLSDEAPKPEPPEITLKPWQANVIELVKEDPSDRDIYFFVDKEGGAGKSTFAKYLLACFEDVQILTPGRHADLAYILDEDVRILIMDCPRSKSETLPYSFLEAVKDRRVVNSKYQVYMKHLKKVHVLVFMNEDPEEGKLSQDRVNVIYVQ